MSRLASAQVSLLLQYRGSGVALDPNLGMIVIAREKTDIVK